MQRKAQTQFTQLVKDINSGKFKYIPKEQKPIDWANYDEAQLNEMDDYLILVRNMVNELESRLDLDHTKPGRLPKSAFDKTKAILVQQYFETANRPATGWVNLFREKLNISERFTYKDLERAYENGDVQYILSKLLDLTNEPIADKETKYSIDGTGMSTSIKMNYADNKQAKGFEKLIACVGSQYKMIAAMAIADCFDNESPYMIPLLDHTVSLIDQIDLVTLDGAYLSRDNIAHIVSLGAVPRIFPKENSVINSEGCLSWKTMMLDLLEDPQQWLRDYHNRSISETVNSVLKNRFPRPLLKKRYWRRKTEVYCKGVAYNIRRLVYLFYVDGIDVRWLKPSA